MVTGIVMARWWLYGSCDSGGFESGGSCVGVVVVVDVVLVWW